jgi:glycosyltransferase involved in cell wall biosynthesis
VRRIVHIPFCYFPEAVGGTEVYVRDLARVQAERGDAVLILAPGDKEESYVHDGIPVIRFAVSNEIGDVTDLYTAAKTDVTRFVDAISKFNAEIVHVHGVSRGITESGLRAARSMGAGIVLTYHTPTTTCIRGTLLQHGAHPCDGILDARRCTACNLTAHGMPTPLATLVARAPAAAGTILRAAGMRGRVTTALRMREIVGLRHEQTRVALDMADQIVAPAEWVMDLLLRLDVPRDKLTLSRQGVRTPAVAPTPHVANDTLRIVYIGRVEPVKGIHLVARALRAMPDAPVELHVYGVVQGDAQALYRRDLQEEMQRDPRIHLHPPVAPEQVIRTIAQYDVLAVPSQQFETGPLVVLEAFAAGLPVVGTALGGIAELVQHDVNGMLVQPGSVLGWTEALQKLAADRTYLARLRGNVKPPRSVDAVADDMVEVYRKALAQ